MDNLTKRNFHALSEGLKAQRSSFEELSIKVNALENAIAIMQQQIAQMQQQLAVTSAMLHGSGATQR